MSRFQSLLVPIDFSSHADSALGTALEIAREHGAKLHLVHAYELPLGAVTPYGVAIPQTLEVDVRDAAARRLEKAAQKVRDAGVGCETHLAVGPASDAIVEIAENVGADLIVMGTRGLTGLQHVLLGSVAERTVRLAPCPVLTLRSDD